MLLPSLPLARLEAARLVSDLDTQGCAVLGTIEETGRRDVRVEWVEEDGTEIRFARVCAWSDES